MHLTKIAAVPVALALLVSCSAAEPEAQSVQERRAASPLGQYLSGSDDLTREESEAQIAEWDRQIEEKVAECMQEEGFEYLPNLSNSTTYSSQIDDWRPDDRDWVSSYGYGILNFPGKAEAVRPSTPVDPNQEHFDALSEQERAAYTRALYGEVPTQEQTEDPGFDPTAVDRGCQGVGWNAVHGARAAPQDQFDDLTTALQQFDSNLRMLPEMVAIEAEWADCMANGGYFGFET